MPTGQQTLCLCWDDSQPKKRVGNRWIYFWLAGDNGDTFHVWKVWVGIDFRTTGIYKERSAREKWRGLNHTGWTWTHVGEALHRRAQVGFWHRSCALTSLPKHVSPHLTKPQVLFLNSCIDIWVPYIQIIHKKCTGQCFLVRSQSCATITRIWLHPPDTVFSRPAFCSLHPDSVPLGAKWNSIVGFYPFCESAHQWMDTQVVSTFGTL